MSQIVWDSGLTAVDAWAVAEDRLGLRPEMGYLNPNPNSNPNPDIILDPNRFYKALKSPRSHVLMLGTLDNIRFSD